MKSLLDCSVDELDSEIKRKEKEYLLIPNDAMEQGFPVRWLAELRIKSLKDFMEQKKKQ